MRNKKVFEKLLGEISLFINMMDIFYSINNTIILIIIMNILFYILDIFI